jgi:hypothetical protein
MGKKVAAQMADATSVGRWLGMEFPATFAMSRQAKSHQYGNKAES